MAFLTFTAGQVLTASQMNTISTQTVSTVTTAGRPSSPTTGQPIHDTTVGAPFYYTGSAWTPTDQGRLAGVTATGLVGTPPAVTGSTRYLTQAGTNVVVLNVYGLASVTFPTAFPTGVVSVVAVVGDYLSFTALAVDDVTTSGYLVVMPGATAGTSQRINWIAVGW